MHAFQVATAVAGILKDSGYFHVEETADPTVKVFELIELAEDRTVVRIIFLCVYVCVCACVLS